jgi:hypothetical protein
VNPGRCDVNLFRRDGCEGIFFSEFGRSSAVAGRRERVGLSVPRKTRGGDFVPGSEGTLIRSRILCRRQSSMRAPLDVGSCSDALEANETLEEEEETGSVGDRSELGNAARNLREGTGGSARDGGDVSGGVTTDRGIDGRRVSGSEGRSFRKEGRMPVLSVMPLGRVCGRTPSELLLFDRL